MEWCFPAQSARNIQKPWPLPPNLGKSKLGLLDLLGWRWWLPEWFQCNSICWEMAMRNMRIRLWWFLTWNDGDDDGGNEDEGERASERAWKRWVSSYYAPCMRASHATFKVRGAAVYIVILIVILIVVILINHCCHRGHPYHHRHSSHPLPHHGYRQLVGPSVVHIPQVHMEIDDSDFKVNWDFIHRDPVLALGQTLGCPCIPKQIGLLASQICQRMHICLIRVLSCATKTLPPQPELHTVTPQDRKLNHHHIFAGMLRVSNFLRGDCIYLYPYLYLSLSLSIYLYHHGSSWMIMDPSIKSRRARTTSRCIAR